MEKFIHFSTMFYKEIGQEVERDGHTYVVIGTEHRYKVNGAGCWRTTCEMKEPTMAEIYTLNCDRCDWHQTGYITDMVSSEYVIDDPETATGALCPDCAEDDDQNHIRGSWLLSW